MLKDIKYLYEADMYEYTLEVIFTSNVKRALSRLYDQWGVKEVAHNSEGCTVIDKNNNRRYALIFRYKDLTDNLISHECQHLSVFILTDRYIDLAGGDDNYENLCWLNGLLNDLVRQIIEKENIEIHQTKMASRFKKL